MEGGVDDGRHGRVDVAAGTIRGGSEEPAGGGEVEGAARRGWEMGWESRRRAEGGNGEGFGEGELDEVSGGRSHSRKLFGPREEGGERVSDTKLIRLYRHTEIKEMGKYFGFYMENYGRIPVKFMTERSFIPISTGPTVTFTRLSPNFLAGPSSGPHQTRQRKHNLCNRRNHIIFLSFLLMTSMFAN